jgi:hypothetical protein
MALIKVAQKGGGGSVAFARDTRADDGFIVQQELVTAIAPKPGRIVLVVDGSKAMGRVSSQIAEALSSLPEKVEFTVLIARDGIEEPLGTLQPGNTELWQKAGQKIRQSTGKGGHDNVPALLRAWDLAGGVPAGAIIWVHGPQPMQLESMEKLKQRFERSPNPPRVISVQTRLGPNVVLEQLDGRNIESFQRTGDLQQDLKRLFASLGGQQETLSLHRQRIRPSATGGGQGPEASLQLVRLWASEEIERLRRNRELEKAMQLATTYHLVTPISGAVVLETQQQFAQAGLEPVPPTSVPVIPEPSSGVLALLAAGLWLLRYRRQSRPRVAL